MTSIEWSGGPLALKQLRVYCDQLNEQNQKYAETIAQLESKVYVINSGAEHLRVDLSKKVDAIAKLRRKELKNELIQRSITETEHILIEATSKSSKLYSENQQLLSAKDILNDEIERLKQIIEDLQKQLKKQEVEITQHDSIVDVMKLEAKNLQFKIDENSFTHTKLRKRNEVLEKDIKLISEENEYLSRMGQTLKAENDLLQNKIKESMEENKELTTAFTNLKEAYETSAKKYEQMKVELEESQILCNTALKQKKEIQVKLDASAVRIKGLEEKTKKLETSLLKKDAEIEHLIQKVKKTIAEYEEKLERKEQMVADITAQLSEETRRQRSSLAQVKIDPDFIKNLEKKYEAREMVFQTEIKAQKALVDEKEARIASLEEQLTEVSKQSFKPRMEKLISIEQGIKEKLEEISLVEEKIEMRLICPHDLAIVKDPCTLLPCGHTFCAGCLETLRSKQKHGSLIHCPSCKKSISHSFRNIQLGFLVEEFSRRREMGRKLGEW